MIKANNFKKWCAEHMGHPPQITYAREAIEELEQHIEQLEVALNKLISVASECDGWESFPSESLEEAHDILNNKD